ncbi:MAG: hypothetical protein M1831_003376 [Alyxoria varia]|nr:MAG: hypothetical protein M1831_003376 [Alyxoria varia]
MAPTEATSTSSLQKRPIVVSGPSGAGKSTILKRLFEEYPDRFGFSISHTTRQPRAGEKSGREYHFTDRPTFTSLVSRNGFLEHATFGGNMYGTSAQTVADVTSRGQLCVLDIEMEGAKQIRAHPLFGGGGGGEERQRPAAEDVAETRDPTNADSEAENEANEAAKKMGRARFLFLRPPSLEILEQRLRGRGTDSEDAIRKRLDQASREIEFADTFYTRGLAEDKVVVNDDVKRAYEECRRWIIEGR